MSGFALAIALLALILVIGAFSKADVQGEHSGCNAKLDSGLHWRCPTPTPLVTQP